MSSSIRCSVATLAKSGPSSATMTPSAALAARAPPSAGRQPCAYPTAITIVAASTNSTADATPVVPARAHPFTPDRLPARHTGYLLSIVTSVGDTAPCPKEFQPVGQGGEQALRKFRCPRVSRRDTNVDLASTTVYAGGGFRRYDDAKVGLLTHGLQYGTGCFEGIRGYWVPEERELLLVLLRDHYDRLATSAKILTMVLPHTVDELVEHHRRFVSAQPLRDQRLHPPLHLQGGRRRRRAPAQRPRCLCDRPDSVREVLRRT